MVVVAGVGDVDAFGSEACAEGEAAAVGVADVLRFAGLTIVIAHTEKEFVVEVHLDTCDDMTREVVEPDLGVGVARDLASEGVGGGGWVECVVVAQVPPLQLGEGGEEAEGCFLQLVGAGGGEFEGEPFDGVVEGGDLCTDVARHEGGDEAPVVANISAGHVDSDGQRLVALVLRVDRLEVGADGEVGVDDHAPPQDQHIVAGAELAGGLVVDVVALEHAVAAETQADGEQSDVGRGERIGQRAGGGAVEEGGDVQRHLALMGEEERRIVEPLQGVGVVDRQIVHAQS